MFYQTHSQNKPNQYQKLHLPSVFFFFLLKKHVKTSIHTVKKKNLNLPDQFLCLEVKYAENSKVVQMVS